MKFAMMSLFFFFFQAEDGIRDIGVTGVQTCALPICAMDLVRKVLRTPLGPEESFSDDPLRMLRAARFVARHGLEPEAGLADRSEERRVGKEGRSRWSPYH